MRKFLVLFLLLLPRGICGQTPSAIPTEDTLDKLASDFWSWRAKYAPFTGDDVNRLERPGGVRDWSAAAIDKRSRDLKDFDARYQKIDASGWPVPQQVDYRLIGSALSRVHWELEVNPRWKRDPNFYIEQTLTPIVEALTVPGPYDEARSREILTRIENVPSILQQGSENGDGVTSRNHAQRGGIEWGKRSRGRCVGTFSSKSARAIAIVAKRNSARA